MVRVVEVRHAGPSARTGAEAHRRRRGVELRLHQVRHQMDDVRLEAPVEKPARGLESEQSRRR